MALPNVGPAFGRDALRRVLARNEPIVILVVNAGISKAAPIESHTVEEFDSPLATNVRAPFFLVQQLLAQLGEGSSIVVGSSLAAHFTPGGSTGVISLPASGWPWLLRSLEKELKRK